MWPLSQTYPQKSPQQLYKEYDYIIVGGGTAGCVLARRLAEDRGCTVLLVERGDARDNWLDKFPLLSTFQFSDKKHSVVATANLPGNRTTDVPSGTGLGGTSRINGMQYTRAVPGEFNAWTQAGRRGWSHDELAPYFRKAEGFWSAVTNKHYGTNGPLQIQAPPKNFVWNCSAQIARAAERIGLADCKDINDATVGSSGHFLVYQTVDQSGYRSSTYRAYLPRSFVLAHTEHLHICTNSIVRKIEITRSGDGTLRATGVVLQPAKQGSASVSVSARKEVILACGALRSPQVLLLSGVGPVEHLNSLGVPVIHALDGVGTGLQDHMGPILVAQCPLWDSIIALFVTPWYLIYQILRYLVLGDGWFKDYFMELSIFTKSSFLDENHGQRPLAAEDKDSSRPENIPDIEIMTGAISNLRAPGFDKSKGGFCMLATLLRPDSRGTVRLVSSNPFDTPVYDLNYLSAHTDRAILRSAVRLCMRLTREMRNSGYAVTDFEVPKSTADDDVDAFIDEQTTSFFHFSSSCRMAPLDDVEGPGVVDDELKVHGVSNLRICDASVFPQVPAAHLMAPVIAIAEKCADMIKSGNVA